MTEKQPTKTPLDLLKKYEEVAAACNRCGFCTSYCPTYLATGSEAQSPRGRNQTVRALIEGKIKNPKDALDVIDTCLLCGECTSVCFSEVPTAQLMVQARHFINQSEGVPGGLNLVLKHLLPHRKRLYWMLKFAFLGKKLGLAKLARVAGLLKKYPALAAADELVDKVPLKFLVDYRDVKTFQPMERKKEEQRVLEAQHKAEKLKSAGQPVPDEVALLAKGTQHPKIAYFPVCGSQYVQPRVGLATLNLFKRLKLEFMVPDAVCCGLPAASYGVLDQVRHLARLNIERLERLNFEHIVVDDSSCTAHLKDYPTYFAGDAGWTSRAHAQAQKVRELSGFLLQQGITTALKRQTWNGPVVAYHDPCKAQYAQRVADTPRDILAVIPRLNLVAIKDSDQCCGGGGTYSFVHPELSQKVLEAKIQNILTCGAKIVVTSSASCLIQLQFGLRQAGSNIEAMHLTEFLVRVLEKSR